MTRGLLETATGGAGAVTFGYHHTVHSIVTHDNDHEENCC